MFDPDHIAPEQVRKLSRAEYDRMVALGMFEDERVELLRGVLVTMSPQGERHAGIAAWFSRKLGRMLDESFDVRAHSPIAASHDSEPEPDVSVSRAVDIDEHPGAPLLLIEVSDSSLRKDRRVKAEIYAESGCPEYWIVDISGTELVVEVHRDVKDGRYRSIEQLRGDDVLRPGALPGVELRVDDIPWR